jgi:hypothetical protein
VYAVARRSGLAVHRPFKAEHEVADAIIEGRAVFIYERRA